MEVGPLKVGMPGTGPFASSSDRASAEHRNLLLELRGAVDAYISSGGSRHSGFTQEEGRYRYRLGSDLRNSNLLGLIAAGLDNLPDPFSALPLGLGSLLGQLRPRDLKGTFMQVVRLLDWYLDQKRPVPVTRLAPRLSLAGITVLAALFFIAYRLAMHLSTWPILLILPLTLVPRLIQPPMDRKSYLNALTMSEYLDELLVKEEI